MPIQHEMVSLSDRTCALILGSLLGDGSLQIHNGYVNARFSFRHSITQQDYFAWKVAQLKEISGPVPVFPQAADGFSKVSKLHYQSMALPALTELHSLTRHHGHFRIERRWLNRMTELSLAVWWLDDGSLISNTRKGVFCTDGFDEESVKRLARYLEVVWHITTHVGTVGRKRNGRQDQYFRLWLRSTEELKKLLRIIAPHVPQSMLYKVLVLYKDPILQQRWISELASLTSFSEAELEAIVSVRKSELAAFQKKI
jgi:predicted house-cleaning noncanonical NTP pyrophosphatase (MazG superfamily)